MEEIRQKLFADQIRREKYGEGRPAVNATHQGHRFVAVGNTIYYAPEDNWRTFQDFLLRHYVWVAIGGEWWKEELAKSDEDCHEVVSWFRAMNRFLKKHAAGNDGLIHTTPNGAMLAFLLLAYDLYTLRHNSALQQRVVERLKNRDQFQGARHELFVAATCVRAGYDIDYEGEQDRAKKHPEFRATFRSMGTSVSVEAKCHNRPLDIGALSASEARKSTRLRIGALLNDALKKRTANPYVVFIEMNLPSSTEEPFDLSWLRKITQGLNRAKVASPDADKFDMVVFTNHPQRYGLDDKPATLGFTRSVVGRQYGDPTGHPAFLKAIHFGALKYANIPTNFDAA